MRRMLRENGLSLVLFALFLLFLAGQILVGRASYNQDREDHDQPSVSYGAYLTSGHFLEATMENWESEFLQMAAFVLLTVFLYQKGSAESKPLEKAEAVDRDPRQSSAAANTPWPVRRGGWVLTLYENSLSLTFVALFLLSFALHAVGGAREYSQEQLLHGGQAVGPVGYLATSQFWFESFENWQSEFLAIGLMVVLSIFLRQKGSPESKPVEAPGSETGEK